MTGTAPPDDAGRRRLTALAGHRRDEAAARRALADPAESVRATALGALARMERLQVADITAALADSSAAVRRRACDVSVSLAIGTESDVPALVSALVSALKDKQFAVVEAASFAIGEHGGRVGGEAIAALSAVVTGHHDALCREAAVAALGAIGQPAGLAAILAATADKAAVRRRAVLALAPFDGPEVDDALDRARSDRDWQVRQAAEDLSAPPP